jgi:hypothetical protein
VDFENIPANLIIIVAIFALLVLNIFIRRWRGERTPLDIAMRLLSDVNQNQKLSESFQYTLSVKKFKTDNWKRNKDKLDFLDEPLRMILDNAFSMAEGFNQDIEAAKKHKSTSYLSGVNAEKLKEPLDKSKHRLENWLQANATRQQGTTGRRGLFG